MSGTITNLVQTLAEDLHLHLSGSDPADFEKEMASDPGQPAQAGPPDSSALSGKDAVWDKLSQAGEKKTGDQAMSDAGMAELRAKSPEDAAKLQKDLDNGSKGKKAVVNDLQMDINKGALSKAAAAEIISGPQGAKQYDLEHKGHNGTSAGAWSIAHQTGGALDGDSSDPKKAGREYIASQVFSLGGLIDTPISWGLDPTQKKTAGGFFKSMVGAKDTEGEDKWVRGAHVAAAAVGVVVAPETLAAKAATWAVKLPVDGYEVGSDAHNALKEHLPLSE